MPKLDSKGRPVSRRVSSEGLETQGPGTWVEFRRRLGMKHIRMVAEMATWQGASFQENPTEVLSMLDRFGEILSQLLVAWNWTDGEGDPLPQPKKNPDVIGELTIDELMWLMQAMADNLGTLGQQGN